VLTAAAKARIAAYGWPGNIRELENVLQRAVILATGEIVEADHLVLGGAFAAVPPVPTDEMVPFMPSAADTPAAMKDLERQHILETLAKVGGSRKKAVELLGISERTLRYKLAQYRQDGEFGTE
jgi:two-component system response regulator FlrC